MAVLERRYRFQVMARLASVLQRSLLTSLVGLLVVVGAVYAHDSLSSDCSRQGHRPATLSMAEPSVPEASVVHDAAGSFSAASGLPSMSDTESEPCEQGKCNHGPGDGCCGTACHAAVAGPALIAFTTAEATSVDPVMSEPSLHGRPVGPGDRPPRSA